MVVNILSLFSSILVPILEEWITDEELCCLDSAVCSQHLRQTFLSLLTLCCISNTSIDEPNNCELHPWIMLRGMGLRKIVWNDEQTFPVAVPLQFIFARTKWLSYLSATCTVDLANLISASGIKVLTLSIRDSDALGIESVLKAVPDVEHLTIQNSTLPNDFEFLLKLCCKSLKNIDFQDMIIPFLLDTSELLSPHAIKVAVHCWEQESEIVELTTFNSVLSLMRFCSNLVCLQVYHRITDSELQTVCGSCPRLTHLDIGGDKIMDSGLFSIALHCTYLQTLKISNAVHISDVGVTHLVQGCILLKCFHVSGRLLTDRMLDAVAQFGNNLREFVLGYCAITNPRLKELWTSKKFDIFGVCGRNCSVDSLVGLPLNARTLIVPSAWTLATKCMYDVSSGVLTHDSNNVSSTFLVSTLLANTGLTRIELRNCALSAEVISTLTKECELLERVVIDFCTMEPSLLSQFKQCTHIKSLMFFSMSISMAVVTELLIHLPKIRKLCLCNGGVDDCTLAAIGQYCSELRSLDIAFSNITTTAVLNLLQKCPHLDSLSLPFTEVDASLLSSIEDRPMRYLNVKSTRISEEDARVFMSNCRVLKKVF